MPLAQQYSKQSNANQLKGKLITRSKKPSLLDGFSLAETDAERQDSGTGSQRDPPTHLRLENCLIIVFRDYTMTANNGL